MILLRNPVHCALMLVVTLFGVAFEFVDQSADFLAAVQIIVYAGAIVILFLFVIMFLGVDRREPAGPSRPDSRSPCAILLGVVALVEILVLSQVQPVDASGRCRSGPGDRDDLARVRRLS